MKGLAGKDLPTEERMLSEFCLGAISQVLNVHNG